MRSGLSELLHMRRSHGGGAGEINVHSDFGKWLLPWTAGIKYQQPFLTIPFRQDDPLGR